MADFKTLDAVDFLLLREVKVNHVADIGILHNADRSLAGFFRLRDG